MGRMEHLECAGCGERVAVADASGSCARCGEALVVRYDLRTGCDKTLLVSRPPSMWRYAEALPAVTPVSLGEGFTALLPSRGTRGLFTKDESRNPTGSAYARGASLIVSQARERGLRRIVIEDPDEAAVAVAAYCAAAGIVLEVCNAVDGPLLRRCEMFGAVVKARPSDETRAWPRHLFLEGWKTLAYEIAEQSGWRLPGAVLWPGDADGVVAIAKGFAELRQLGWTHGPAPRIFFVPLDDAPVSKLLERIVGESGGVVARVMEKEASDAQRAFAAQEGIAVGQEGGAAIVAYRKLLDQGTFKPGQAAVVVNPSSASGRADAWLAQPRSRSIGGIIQPY